MNVLVALYDRPDLVLGLAAWGAAVAVGALDLWERVTREKPLEDSEEW